MSYLERENDYRLMLYLEFFFFCKLFLLFGHYLGLGMRFIFTELNQNCSVILVRLTSENRTFSSLWPNSLCSVRLKAQTDWFMEISIEKDKEKPKLLTRLKLSRAAAIAAGAAAQEQPQPLLSLSLSHGHDNSRLSPSPGTILANSREIAALFSID